MTTTSYRVKFPSDDGAIKLVGIVDCPSNWHVPDAGARSQRPRQPVVVYSHCFTCNKDLKATVRISRALAQAGVAVLRFDMRGLGGSQGEFSQSNFTTNLADLAAAIRFADHELGPVTGLVGHSFGGIASLVTAAAAETPAGPSPPTDAPPLEHLGFAATLAAPSDTAHLADLLSRMNPEIDRRGAGEVTIGGISWRVTREMLEDFRNHDVTAQLPHVRCPVLLLHSPVDETVGFDHALRLMGLIQNSRPDDASGSASVSLVALGGADHLLTNQRRDLKFVADLLASWCARY